MNIQSAVRQESILKRKHGAHRNIRYIERRLSLRYAYVIFVNGITVIVDAVVGTEKHYLHGVKRQIGFSEIIAPAINQIFKFIIIFICFAYSSVAFALIPQNARQRHIGNRLYVFFEQVVVALIIEISVTVEIIGIRVAGAVIIGSPVLNA